LLSGVLPQLISRVAKKEKYSAASANQSGEFFVICLQQKSKKDVDSVG